MLELIHELARILTGVFVPLVREIHLPISSLDYDRLFVRRDLQIMPRRQKLHAFKTSHRPRHRSEGEDVVNPPQIRLGTHHPGCEQPFDFRRKQQPIALPRPVKRRDAEAVAAEREPSSLLLPQRDGKLPAKPLKHALLVIFPQMRDDLRVAMSAQLVPAIRQLGASLCMVKKLAVKHDVNTPVFIRHRLLTIGQAHDAQPTRSQRQPWPDKKAFLIRPTVGERPRHRLNSSVGHRVVPG